LKTETKARSAGSKEKFVDIKSRKSKDRQYNGQMKKDKQLCTTHYREN